MNPELKQFVAEIRAEPTIADFADDVENVLKATYEEGAESGDAIEFLDAVRWVVRQRSRSLLEKSAAILKLATHETNGREPIHLRKFLGW